MHHTTPEQAAKVFNDVQPKLAAYSHIVKIHGLTEEDIIKRTKANYKGLIIMGEDLMSFSISDTVSVNKWQNK
jgi:ribonuclease Z